MKIQSLRCCDYLDWLKQEEEYLLWAIEFAEPEMAVDLGEELQIVRELKDLVVKWEGKNAN